MVGHDVFLTGVGQRRRISEVIDAVTAVVLHSRVCAAIGSTATAAVRFFLCLLSGPDTRCTCRLFVSSRPRQRGRHDQDSTCR